MAIFLTGSTGYIGAHVLSELLSGYDERVALLIRAKNEQEAAQRLWHALQLHMDFAKFREYLRSRITIFRGDLTDWRFGLDAADYGRLIAETHSVIHCAASLNRKSEKSCMNVNLRGTLAVIQLAHRAHGLRRFSFVSTVAVAGRRQRETVAEDTSIDWNISDWDPYARTKKFCEHMVRELLPDVPKTIFRPSIVLGDTRYGATTQFDMVRAFAFLAGLAVLPLRPNDRIDTVPVDYVAQAIARIHQQENPAHEIYHLSSGAASETCRQITDALARASGGRKPTYVPALSGMFEGTVNWLSNRKGNLGRNASLLKVFLPYLYWNVVFDNSRVAAEMGAAPAPFTQYCYPLLKFSRENRFRYPYVDWAAAEANSATAMAAMPALQNRGAVS
ncbi:MAG TPA: SDR family oxidoreductase [Candidatus Acidoferrales bacterium]|nr:SDR family oxidoreductase [Candidatus Acidoferrales bacterium]